mgnify:CR=1 FL=1
MFTSQHKRPGHDSSRTESVTADDAAPLRHDHQPPPQTQPAKLSSKKHVGSEKSDKTAPTPQLNRELVSKLLTRAYRDPALLDKNGFFYRQALLSEVLKEIPGAVAGGLVGILLGKGIVGSAGGPAVPIALAALLGAGMAVYGIAKKVFACARRRQEFKMASTADVRAIGFELTEARKIFSQVISKIASRNMIEDASIHKSLSGNLGGTPDLRQMKYDVRREVQQELRRRCKQDHIPFSSL